MERDFLTVKAVKSLSLSSFMRQKEYFLLQILPLSTETSPELWHVPLMVTAKTLC